MNLIYIWMTTTLVYYFFLEEILQKQLYFNLYKQYIIVELNKFKVSDYKVDNCSVLFALVICSFR